MYTNDSFANLTILLSSAITRPNRTGNRKDKKICNAKPGECRHNNKYYTPGMRDKASWSMPSADETCSLKCPYLIEP